ncbi:biliverdin-producing heme oxygenase [Phenylobacterium sp.]|uniref:biliverdin-producing heme oxygenase n=1 Tax=Phenylobacterium sp. TaxID=1871053 RepID=UPI00179242C5|nr:biliverdin-producing heme oxygenase [Phenylobacterium sp.]MBA4794039.1 biliverdin-producing heme oxygenase [Phenylobacterium sp.]
MKLRAATRAAHERVDRLGESFDLASPAGYRAFLRGHGAALPGLERRLEAAGVGRLLSDWPSRRRTGVLLQDLAAVAAAPPEPVASPGLHTRAQLMGALYVLEGSRLGGAYLRRRLAQSQPDAPAAYLAHGAGEPLWRTFVEWLGAQTPSPAEEATAIAAADATFATFETGFRQAAREAA